ncbi:MAG: hypothetical protein WCO20_12060 [Holophagaceae bacterium]
MKRTIHLGALALLLSLLGCVKPEPVMFRVSLGMPDKQLMEALGPPVSIAEDAQGKILHYQTWTNNMHGNPSHRYDWHVHVVDGKVVAFDMDGIWVSPGPAPAPAVPKS